jgi:hypothetical protein
MDFSVLREYTLQFLFHFSQKYLTCHISNYKLFEEKYPDYGISLLVGIIKFCQK